MHVGRHAAACPPGCRPARIGHRGGEGPALHAADSQSPPCPTGGRDRCTAAATGRAWDPAHPGGATAGRPGSRDHRTYRCRRCGARRPRGADRRAGPPGRLLFRDRVIRSAGRGGACRHASGPAGQPDRHAPTRGVGAAARRHDRRRGHLPLRRDRTRARRRPPAPSARRSGVPAVHPARAHAGHPVRRDVDRRAAKGAAATCWRCAPTRASSRGSATPPTTWW